MNSKRSIMAVVIGWLLLMQTAWAQIEFNAQLLTTDIKSFFIKDLINSTTAIDIFRIDLTNNSDTIQSCSISLKIERGANRAPLGDGETKWFDLLPVGELPSPGSTALASPTILTNRNLFSNLETLFSLQGGFTITDAGDELQNYILATGRLPADLYIFTIKLNSETSVSPMDEYELQLDLRVAGTETVTLLGPGSNEYNPVEEINTIFPNFQWDSGLTKFKLILAERLDTVPGITELDPEDILNTRVIFEKILQIRDASGLVDPGAEAIASDSYQYTEGLLQFGRTYYYQVIGLQGSTSGAGEEEIQSEIWAFKIKDIAGGTSSGLSIEAILNSFGLIPGLELALAGLFEEGGELWGFHPENILIGGNPSTLGELAAFIAELYRQGKNTFNIVID